jgi:hypothetical protein
MNARYKILNEAIKNAALYMRIDERLGDVADVQGDYVIRTKTGRLEVFNGKQFKKVSIESLIDQIACGIKFTLAKTVNGGMYLIVFKEDSYKIQPIARGVKRIFACGHQLYFETENRNLMGAEYIDLDHYEDHDLDDDDLFHETYSQILDADNRVDLPEGSELIDLFLGLATSAAIVKLSTSEVHLFMWGDNSCCQCGKQGTHRIFATKPFNVSKKYADNLPAPAQVACLKSITVLLTITSELYAMGNAVGSGAGGHQPKRIDLGIDDISSIKTSSYYSMLVIRKHYGAVALGSSPNGNLGPQYKTKIKDFFKTGKKILQNYKVLDASMSETLTVVKVCDNQMIKNHTSILSSLCTDLDIICVVRSSSSSNKKKRPDPFTNHNASVKRHKK